jgi:hypothetical protein
MEQMYNFDEALVLFKQGKSMYREGWNGKGMFITAQFPDENSKMSRPYLYITLASGERVPWLPSQSDLFADDWIEFRG